MSISNDLENIFPKIYAVYRKHLYGNQIQSKPFPSTDELEKMVPALKILQTGFTGNRRKAGQDYFSDKLLLGAYLMYYWPVSYVQARVVFDELAKQGLSPKSLLDLGAGPGPVAMAALSVFQIEKIELVDHSEAALEIAKSIISEISPKTEVSTVTSKLENFVSDQKYDLISFGHSINEVKANTWTILQKFSKALSPNGAIAIIEPALKEQNAHILSLRNQAVHDGYTILHPCFYSGPCPALADNQPCHSTYSESVPKATQLLARLAGLQKLNISMSTLAFSKGQTSPQGFRVISEPLLNKAGRTRLNVCGEKGKMSMSAHLGKDIAFQSLDDFKKLKRGLSFTIENPEIRENGFGLKTDTKIQIGS